jgi:hypothetical protein
MSALKGFGDSGDNEESKPSPATLPRPGTMAYLRYIEEKKGKKKEEGRNECTTPETGSPPRTGPTPIIEAPPETEAVQYEDVEVHIDKNFMRFDRDVFGVLSQMTGAEAKIYLDFIRRAYGQRPPRNACSATNSMIARDTGISSPTTLAKTLQDLEEKGFIKRLFTARKSKEMSFFRVFLPCELPNSMSKTVISFKNRPGD